MHRNSLNSPSPSSHGSHRSNSKLFSSSLPLRRVDQASPQLNDDIYNTARNSLMSSPPSNRYMLPYHDRSGSESVQFGTHHLVGTRSPESQRCGIVTSERLSPIPFSLFSVESPAVSPLHARSSRMMSHNSVDQLQLHDHDQFQVDNLNILINDSIASSSSCSSGVSSPAPGPSTTTGLSIMTGEEAVYKPNDRTQLPGLIESWS